MDRIKIGKVEPAGYKAMVGLHEHGEPPLQPAGAGQPDPGDRDHQRLEPHRHLNADGAAPGGLRGETGPGVTPGPETGYVSRRAGAGAPRCGAPNRP